jgi:hypothetical protein
MRWIDAPARAKYSVRASSPSSCHAGFALNSSM